MKPTIVFWGIHSWRHPTAGRIRYFAESAAELYKDLQVVYINPPNQYKIPFRHRDFWCEWYKAKLHPLEMDNGVNLLTIPPCPLPYAHHLTPLRFLRAIYLGKRIWTYLGKGQEFPPLIIGDPKEWPLAHWWKSKGGAVVYDCSDLMPAFHHAGDRVARDERNLAQCASIITCSAQGLVEHIKSIAPDKPVFLIRNGVHWERFQNTYKVPCQLKDIPYPRIGFVGSISYWIDIDLVAEVAKRRSDWHFVLIGPARVSVPQLPNIHLLPPVPPGEVNCYIHGFNVSIIPFRDMPLTRCVNPLKLYEYLACGKPVVATPYGDFGDVGQWVYFAQNPDEFVTAIHKALCEDTSELHRLRREAARFASWNERTKQLFTIVEKFIKD